tara:strand:+ start:1978 stop:3336 length:1359 start_codon:yes stop_codon:yes gene_type:complete
MINFGKSVNTIVFPEYSESEVIKSLVRSAQDYKENEKAKRRTALDFYLYQNTDEHVQQWFESESLQQVPVYPQAVVQRFARARMMLYKSPAKRYIGGEINDDYNSICYMLDSKIKMFSEIAWLLGDSYLKTSYNSHKERLEYTILPEVKEYHVMGESVPFGMSYEVESPFKNKRMFVYWSEDRDGVKGSHFKFDQDGKRYAVGDNTEMINPYGILPITKVDNLRNSYDVVRSALQISIAMTEIALNVRFRLGQPVFTGIDEGQSEIKSGIDNAIFLSEGSDFKYVAPNGNMMEMIEAVKLFANITAENNHLRIRWGESGGNAPSGEALRILELENHESRESDMLLYKEFESERYKVDRKILEVHNVMNLPEEYHIDFGEVEYPMSVEQELKMLDWKIANNVMTQKDVLQYFNPDMSDSELESKLGEVQEEKNQANEQERANQPVFGGLRTLG